MSDLLLDLRHAFRTLRRNPGFAAVGILTLALGIGANTTMFSVVNAVLLRQLDYPHAERLVAVWTRYLPSSGYDYQFSTLGWPEYEEYRNESKTLSDVAAYTFATTNVTEGLDEPQRLQIIRATPNLFRVLDVAPVVGRAFADEDGRPGASCTAVLSHDFWVQRFGRDAEVPGRTLRLDGEPCTVLGVMPPGFAFPRPGFQIWQALAPSGPAVRLLTERESHWISGVGRLRQGVTREEADAEANTIAARWGAAYSHHKGHFVVLQPLREALVGQSRRPLFVLLAAVGLVLVIVCANLASLLLARAEGRRREIAVRVALGVTRGRLVRQLLTESTLLALVGGLLGLVLATWALPVVARSPRFALPRADQIGLDGVGVLFNLGISLIAGILFGLAPAFQSATRRVHETLRSEGRTTQGHRRGTRVRRGLVVAEVALAMTLVVGATLLARSYAELRRVHLGFDPENMVAMRISLPRETYADQHRVTGFYAELGDQLAGLAGIVAAGAISDLPLASWPSADDFVIEGRPAPRPGEPGINAGYYTATPGALEALGVPLVRGRGLTASDAAGAPLVALINAAAARQYWPDQEPIGQRIHYYGADSAKWMTIVGIVGDTRYRLVSEPPRPAVYAAHGQLPRWHFDGRDMTLLVRTATEGAASAALLRRTVRDLEPAAVVDPSQPMAATVAQATGQPRFLSLLMTGFAGIALVLGALGIYGLVAQTMRQRTGEFGVRLAIGASPADILRLVLSQALRLAGLGVALGLVGALLLGQAVRALLFGVTAADPATFAAVAIIVLSVAVLAGWLPARHATRIDPVEALRHE